MICFRPLDAVIGEGGDAIFTDPVDAQTAVFSEQPLPTRMRTLGWGACPIFRFFITP